MKNHTNAVIAKLASLALSRLRAAGLNEGGRAHFGSFAEAKRVTKNFASMVRSDVRGANEKEAVDTMEVSGSFRLVTVSPESLTFRGWAELRIWLRTVESHLKELVAKEYIVEADEWVCFRAVGNSSRIRRYSKAWPTTSLCQRLVDGVWVRCALSVAEAISLLEYPEYIECNEEGEPLQQLKMSKLEPKAEEWVYFARGSAEHFGTLRRYKKGADEGDFCEYAGEGWHVSTMTVRVAQHELRNGFAVLMNENGTVQNPPRAAQPEVKEHNQATDPETGHTYRVTSRGDILVRQAGGHSFYSGACNVNVVKAVIKLGLVKSDPSECEY